MSEQWLPIAGYVGKYEVSSRGRVRSLVFVNVHANERRAEPLLMRQANNGGYRLVTLCKQRKEKVAK